ncbi:hypothetical protein [Aquabacterium sp.]|uniref:hypothetical protein n=1 Tax=Aquabacterium sp. TaxID=1872578 RepID=UPI0039C85B8D
MSKSSVGWRICAMVLMGAMVSGCDQLGLETPAKTAEKATAESRAVGSACRHAMRAIEDCYLLNPKAEKASVFAGWREMDEYMRENKLEGVAPQVPRPATGASKAEEDDEEVIDEEADASATEGRDTTSADKAASGAKSSKREKESAKASSAQESGKDASKPR